MVFYTGYLAEAGYLLFIFSAVFIIYGSSTAAETIGLVVAETSAADELFSTQGLGLLSFYLSK